MPHRNIKSWGKGGSMQLADCLSSVLVLELWHPSPELYLISPWLSEVSLISNRLGQFRSLVPDGWKYELRLTDILIMLAERGTLVRVIYNPHHQQTQDFIAKLPTTIECRGVETLHEKGLISHHFYIHGSMNFTYSGVNVNDEKVELTDEPEDVSFALVDARLRWEEAR